MKSSSPSPSFLSPYHLRPHNKSHHPFQVTLYRLTQCKRGPVEPVGFDIDSKVVILFCNLREGLRDPDRGCHHRSPHNHSSPGTCALESVVARANPPESRRTVEGLMWAGRGRAALPATGTQERTPAPSAGTSGTLAARRRSPGTRTHARTA